MIESVTVADLFLGLLGCHVTVKARDRVQIEGRLVHVERSRGHNGGFGNLVVDVVDSQLSGVKGSRVLIRGSWVVAVLRR